MARIRCLYLGLPHASSDGCPCGNPDTAFRPVGPHQTAFAQGSFAPEALPSFLATMSPCAGPEPPTSPSRLRPYRRCPCRLRHPRLLLGTVPVFRSAFLACVLPPLRREEDGVHLPESSPIPGPSPRDHRVGSSE